MDIPPQLKSRVQSASWNQTLSTRASSKSDDRWCTVVTVNGDLIESYSSGAVSSGKYFLTCSRRAWRCLTIDFFTVLKFHFSPWIRPGNISILRISICAVQCSTFHVNASILSFSDRMLVFFQLAMTYKAHSVCQIFKTNTQDLLTSWGPSNVQLVGTRAPLEISAPHPAAHKAGRGHFLAKATWLLYGTAGPQHRAQFVVESGEQPGVDWTWFYVVDHFYSSFKNTFKLWVKCFACEGFSVYNTVCEIYMRRHL